MFIGPAVYVYVALCISRAKCIMTLRANFTNVG